MIWKPKTHPPSPTSLQSKTAKKEPDQTQRKELGIELCQMLNEKTLDMQRFQKVLDQLGNILGLVNSHNDTPLHIAARTGHLEVVKTLIEHGNDINTQGAFNFTPLHLAVQNNHKDLVELLLKEGANRELRGGFDDNQMTAKELAEQEGEEDIIALFKPEKIITPLPTQLTTTNANDKPQIPNNPPTKNEKKEGMSLLQGLGIAAVATPLVIALFRYALKQHRIRRLKLLPGQLATLKEELQEKPSEVEQSANATHVTK